MPRHTTDFQTIRSEGGLLPSDLLRRVIDPKSKLDGTRPEDYGLPQGERLNEVITQSWNRLRKHWAEFRTAAASLPEGEPGTGLTNDKWSLPLLRELGFGLLPTSAGPDIGGRTYAINRFFGAVPVHLVGFGLSLDRRVAGVRGAAVANPHGLVQEFVNRSPGHSWAIVANGLRLRVLRDNQALSRQSFLEFDLEAMFAGEVYSDFVLLWLTVHATRFAPREPERPESCWLEQWTKLAEEQGTRALGDLRGGVERALLILGEGFTSHPKNTGLRDSLRTGQVPLNDFHGQLLRVVYRLIFLFVSEDRTLDGQPLLHPRDSSDAASTARERFSAHYGTARLRELASKIKGSRHGDLWGQFHLLVGALSGEAAFAAARECLALPKLGSFLWNLGSTAALNDAELTNHDFLEALRHLAFTRQGKALRPVDFRSLGAEELGGVYEGLLALTPQVSADGARFTFAEFAGNERKTSGSYYTPDSLVQCLLDSSLEPVIDEAIKGKTGSEAEKSILALKVCDPAVGSGHFLIGAAHRLAKHLASVRALAQGDSAPSALLYQHALRDVIGRCLYGVDANPMAAELCRVSLWLEAVEPGKPLSFLDHHIRIGNSLLGTTPQLIAAGLPDEAFTTLEGDDKEVTLALRTRNKRERDGQMDMLHLMVASPEAEYNSIATRTRSIDEGPDDTIGDVQRKAEEFQRLVLSPEYRHRQWVADAWCAAFVWTKHATSSVEPITTDVIRRFEADADALEPAQHREVERLSLQFQFFHWHLAFPEALSDGGFDCILGNPPWERITIRDKEWFSNRASRVADAGNAAARASAITHLSKTDHVTFKAFEDDKWRAAAEKALTRNTGVYPLCGHGDVNLFALFAEKAQSLLASNGSSGLILPTGIATAKTTAPFFESLVTQRKLVSIFDFDNRGGAFPAVQGNVRFCLLTTAASKRSRFLGASFLLSPQDLSIVGRTYLLGQEDLRAINPNTLGCPLFASERDAEVVKLIYRSSPILAHSDQARTPWHVELKRMFHMGDDAHLFRTREALADAGFHLEGNVFRNGADVFVPLYESKLAFQFNHRATTFEGISPERRFGTHPATTAVLSKELIDPFFLPIPRYWMSSVEAESKLRPQAGLLSFRNAISATADSRSLVATILPRRPAGDSLKFIFSDGGSTEELYLVGCLNSFIVDYVLRQKASGGNASLFILEQLPIAKPSDELDGWLRPRLLELIYTAWDLESFAKACGWSGPPFYWDDERRFLIRCELDAAFFRLYLPADTNGDWRGTEIETAEDLRRLKASFPRPRDAVAYVMDTFPIVRRKDEEKYNGDYRTKRVILEIYDALAECLRTGQPYRSRVNPLPGPPIDAAGVVMSMYQLDRSDWPPHLHLPHSDWDESLLAAWFDVRQQRWVYVEDGQVFPWDGRETFVYALIPFLIHERPGKKFEFYRDAALLASYQKRCETLLLEDESRENYRLAMRGLDWLQFPDAHRFRPRRIREVLQGKKILQTDANSGATTLSSAKSLPLLPSELRPLMELILKAADNLERVQRDALERAESMKLGVRKEELIRELGGLMAA